VLIDGLKCDEDFNLFRKKRILSQVLSLFNAEILDHASKVSQLLDGMKIIINNPQCMHEGYCSRYVCVCVCYRATSYIPLMQNWIYLKALCSPVLASFA
jgi:hypothetical protein